jgi:AraC family transcriptional regulator
MTNSQWDLLPETPTLSSQGLDWDGILVERLSHTPSTGLELPASAQHLVTLYLGSPLYLQQKRNGEMHEGKHVRGDITIVPAGCSSQWLWQGNPDVLRLRFDSQFLLSLIDPAEYPSSGIELTNQG